MHRKAIVLTVTRLFASAMLAAALLVGAGIGCAVAAKADTVALRPHHPVVLEVDWADAFTLMSRDHWWCEVAGQTPPLPRHHVLMLCTSLRPRVQRFPVDFLTAIFVMRFGGAATRQYPGHWLVTSRFFALP